MIVSAVDVDADLDNVTQELKDLKLLVGRYETCATELQSELKMANNEYVDLLNVRSSRPSNTHNELQSKIEMYEKEMGEVLRTNKKQELIINKLRKKAQRYQEELDLALKSMATLKNSRFPNEDLHTNKTEDKQTQTMMISNKAENEDSLFPLIVSRDNRLLNRSEEVFTHELLDMTFDLHEQLSKCHARRSWEHNELNKFVMELNKMYRQSIVKLRERQRKDLLALSNTIQRSAESQMELLRNDQQNLKIRLNKAEAAEKASRTTIANLQSQIERLTKQLNVIYQNKETIACNVKLNESS